MKKITNKLILIQITAGIFKKIFNFEDYSLGQCDAI
jgi:hypothetical protein